MLDSIIGMRITITTFAICTAVSLVLGLGIALLCMRCTRYTRSFVLTLAVLPAMVQVIIMLVNGNLGAGVAVAGTFGLVRFRSASGTAQEIGLVFLAMAVGLATGMGYVVLAVLFFTVIAAVLLLLIFFHFGEENPSVRELKITIPENLDYDGLFDDLFSQYTRSAQLEQVKTSHMGTLYELDYRIFLKGDQIPKEFLDQLRCRNGNLQITCGRLASREAL